MKRNFTFKEDDFLRTWIVMDEDAEYLDLEQNASLENIQKFLDEIAEEGNVLEAVSVEANKTGEYLPPAKPGVWPYMTEDDPQYMAIFLQRDLPDYVDVTVTRTTEAHVETLHVWVPNVWNGRFVATSGAGCTAETFWGMPPFCQGMGIGDAIKNHFSVCYTNGAATVFRNGSPYDYALREDGTLDYELIKDFDLTCHYWQSRVGKAVTKALTGQLPEFSYTEGMSGGGSQVIEAAAKDPTSFDGYLATDPMTNYMKGVPRLMWNQLVMKDYQNQLTEPKLDAFRDAVLAKYGGYEEWCKVVSPTFDASECLGVETADGPITELDVRTQQLIWDGPKCSDGTQLYPGYKPGALLWGDECGLMGTGMLGPDADIMTQAVVLTWIFKGEIADWHDLTMDTFADKVREVYDSGEFDFMIGDHADFSGLAKTGGKLLCTASGCDENVRNSETLAFFDRSWELMGGKEKGMECVRVHRSPGGGHCHSLIGLGAHLTQAMIALMKWVEDGIAPESLLCHKLDGLTLTCLDQREVPIW